MTVPTVILCLPHIFPINNGFNYFNISLIKFRNICDGLVWCGMAIIKVYILQAYDMKSVSPGAPTDFDS